MLIVCFDLFIDFSNSTLTSAVTTASGKGGEILYILQYTWDLHLTTAQMSRTQSQRCDRQRSLCSDTNSTNVLLLGNL